MISARQAPDFRQIPIALIDEPALPSRTTMDEQRLAELVTSIRTLGFISAIVVVAISDRFRVVAGHRRTIAARQAGVVALPCLVYIDEAAALDAIQHAENRHREELSVTDEAIWFAQLLEAHPEDGTDGLALRVGETRNYVENRLALLNGCDRVFQALANRSINVGVAQQLNRCSEDAHRFMLLDMAVRGGATVGLVTQWIAEWKTIHAPASGHLTAISTVEPSSYSAANEYFRCKVCGENTDTPNMTSVQMHTHCLRTLIDPSTGYVRTRADTVNFPRTREEAVALVRRVLERFPELADEHAA